jgi:hypothetical protein
MALPKTPLSKQTAKDLEAVADLLCKLPRKRFDYARWVGVGMEWEGKPDLSRGTTACALGWATKIPRFRRRGLRLSGVGSWGYVMPRTDSGNSGLLAGAEFFKISYEESRYLFSPVDSGLSSGATPKQVAKHIRKFIKERVK